MDIGIADDLLGSQEPRVPGLPATLEGIEAEFFLAIYRYAKAWLLERGGQAESSAPCAFVHLRAVTQELQRLAAAPIGHFRHRPDHDVCGGIYVASGDFSIVARTAQAHHADIDALERTLVGCGLAGCTRAIFRADRRELILCRSHPSGSAPSTKVDIELGAPVRLSLEQLERWIWRFHSAFTQLPGGVLLPWDGSPRLRIPMQELERRISGNLCFYLNKDLGDDYASAEHHVDGSRLDIKVAKEAMVPGHGHCAIELKVLKSREPSGTAERGFTTVSANEMTKHAMAGVDQAHDYRVRLGAGSAYLCCFDARLQDEDQPDVLAWATRMGVNLRRYFMYDSPKSYRNAKAAAIRDGRLLPGEVD